MPKFITLLLTLTFLVTSKLNAKGSSQELVLSASGDSYLNGVVQAVGDRAFGKYDIKFTLKNFPKARALVVANTGEADGDAYRVYDFHKKTKGKYPNLTLVDAPFMSIYWTAFVTDRLNGSKINGWKDMKNLRVVGIRGNKTMEYRMKEHFSKDNRNLVTRYHQAFEMLLKGRVDVVLGKPSVGAKYMKNYDNINMFGRFEVQDLYIYLHKKHQHLVPKIESEIRAMREDGTLSKIEQEVRSRLNLPPHP